MPFPSFPKMSGDFPVSPKADAPARGLDHMVRFQELAEFWDESATKHGWKLFAVRFEREIQSLLGHQRDFPGKNPALLLRVLELRLFLAFRREFPARELSRVSSRLRGIVKNLSLP